MNKVAITTNSACISAAEARKYDVTIIPFHIIMDGKDYLDSEIDMESLYARLDERQNLPTSSTPTIEEFLQVFSQLSQSAESILHISMPQAFTGAYNLALQAKEAAGEKLPQTTIEVIDSRTVGGGLLLICIEAAKAAKQGRNIKEVVELVNHLIPRVSEISSRDALFYLDKGGRIFEAKSWAEAEAVSSFRTIGEIDASTGGVLKPLARAKTKGQIMNKMVDIVNERVKGKKLRAAIIHTNVPDQAEQLKQMILSQFQCEKFYVSEGSAAVAVSTGQGLINLSFYGSD